MHVAQAFQASNVAQAFRPARRGSRRSTSAGGGAGRGGGGPAAAARRRRGAARRRHDGGARADSGCSARSWGSPVIGVPSANVPLITVTPPSRSPRHSVVSGAPASSVAVDVLIDLLDVVDERAVAQRDACRGRRRSCRSACTRCTFIGSSSSIVSPAFQVARDRRRSRCRSSASTRAPFTASDVMPFAAGVDRVERC